MESWKQGHGELLEQLENVCKQIGKNIASELKSDKLARISHEELRILRETSANVQKLAESHGRLTDELEICRGAAAKVEELEKENKRLAQELQTKLKQDSTPVPKPTARAHYGNILDLTPGSSEPTSSVARIEPGESNQAIQRKYDDLTKKYNKVCQKLDAMKGAKELAENLAKGAKLTSQNWSKWGKGMTEKVERRDEKIAKLQEEINELKAKLSSSCGETGSEYGTDQQPAILQALDGKSLPLQNVAGDKIQVPASSPPKSTAMSESRRMDDSGADDGHGDPETKDMDLPLMLEEDNYIGDTSFEPLEVHCTSSTEGDPDPAIVGDDAVANLEPENNQSSSAAEFISSRSIKKRRTRHQNADETSGPKIKTEIIELSSPHTPIPAYMNTHESMDLDDIGEKVSTPRKVQKVAALSRLATKSQISGPSRSRSQGRKNTAVMSVAKPAQQEKSVLQPRSINTNTLPRTSDYTRALKKRRIASDREVADLTEDGEIPGLEESPRKQTSTGDERLIELLSKPSPGRPVLNSQQTRSSVQSSILSTLGTREPTPRLKVVSTSALAQELLGGETPLQEHSASKPQPEKRNPNREPTPNPGPSSARPSHELIDLKASSTKQMIQGPLDSSKTSSRQGLKSSAESVRPGPKALSGSYNEPKIGDEKSSGRSPSPLPGTQLPARRDLASAFKSRTVQELAKASPRTPTVGRPVRHNRTETAKKRKIQTEVDFEMDPSQEPLRARPMTKFNLSDFKVNPNYNRGYDYAYNDVVRGKDARACLEGCIKPGCCGYKFRGLAKAELDIRRLSLSQEERDEALMEEYLGADANRLRYMSRAEKEETLIQAKTRELANKNGRHRHAYHRQSSPSGYWRTDFPTTQEDMEDRARIKAQEREEVEQRYRHAMRPGGAWLFRDE